MQPEEPYRPKTPEQQVDFRELLEKLSGRLRSQMTDDHFGPIEQLVDEAPDSYRSAILEALVIEEIQLQKNRGAEPTLEAYLQRFPDRTELVENAWRRSQAVASFGTDEYGNNASDSEVLEFETRATDDSEPVHFGSYKVLRLLGAGTFGSVYQAQHESTGEVVAIKMLKTSWAKDPECGQSMRLQFAEEAKRMLQFDHPHVVRVISLDERTDPPFFVQQYIDGTTLSDRLLANRLTLQQTVEFAIQIADGLAHIHSHECWHRDLKPANILLDRNNHVYLADFGLALDEAQRWSTQAGAAGTYPYMAPEQIHGATHRLNARCDIWALGVIMYEMLTGRRPFRSNTREQLCEDVTQRTPPAPRELNQAVPRELNRLCMQCLSKSDAARPHTAADVRDDLMQILATLNQSVSKDSASIASDPAVVVDDPAKSESSTEYPVPTLKRFTAEQAELYLRLMPRGYATEEELPELITFWKKRIIQSDPNQTFAVGIMVGVSGCGKSSMLEAGLVPSLPESIIPILIEASETETEARILSKLRRALPDADPDEKWSLVDWTFRIRRGSVLPSGKKVVFVLDQFEQWLNAHGGESTNPLLDALHQCDGEHLQAIICVREGFHATLMRFVEVLNVSLDDQDNYATAHRFTPDHARFVLTQFGRGLRRVDTPPTREQQAFIDATVDALAESDRGVVCVRLVVLALVMQDRPWSVEELDQLGGLDGIGSQFLVDCFEGRTASEQYRRYLPAAMRVLADLLPAQGLEIKDVRSYEHLLAASEMDKLQFDDLLNILVRKLFLLTPVEQVALESSTPRSSPSIAPSPASNLYYQLTHDFLVPSIRDWLARKLRETKEGRAQLRLQERTAAWTVKSENRNLPSIWEWVTIGRLTDPKKWKPAERLVMRRAGRLHAWRTGFVAVSVVFVAFMGLRINRYFQNQQLELQAINNVESLAQADFENLARILTDLRPLRDRATDKLMAAFDVQTDGSDAQLKLALGLLDDDPTKLQLAADRLVEIPSTKFTPVRDLLIPYQDQIVTNLWTVALDTNLDAARRFQSACALATFDPVSPSWDNADFTRFLAEHIVGVLPSDLPVWQQALLPVRQKLVPGLSDIFRDANRREQERSFATDTLKTYAAGDVDTLAVLVTDADTEGFKTLFPVLAAEGDAATKRLTDVLNQTLVHDWKDAPLDPSWTQPSATLKATLETHGGLLETRFALVQTLPWERIGPLAAELGNCGYRPIRIRPYLREGETLVAALWHRDGRRWELQQGLLPADLPDPQKPVLRDGLVPYDIAVEPLGASTSDQSQDDSPQPNNENSANENSTSENPDVRPSPRFCLLWGEVSEGSEQRRVAVDLAENQFEGFLVSDGFYASPFEGFPSQTTVIVWTDVDGARHYGGIWSNVGAASETNLGFDGQEYFDQPQWDIALGDEPTVANPLDVQRTVLQQIDTLPNEERENPRALSERATALFHLGSLEACKEQIEALFAVDANAENPDLQRLAAWTLARLGEEDAAREALAKHLETASDPVMRIYGSAPMEAYLGNHQEAGRQLADAVASAAGNPDDLYNVACAAALASLPTAQGSLPTAQGAQPTAQGAQPAQDSLATSSQSPSEASSQVDVPGNADPSSNDGVTDPPSAETNESSEQQRASYRKLGIAVLQQAIAAGYQNGSQMASDVDLATLHDDGTFQRIVQSLVPSRRVVGLWRYDIDHESRLVQSGSPDALLEEARPLIETGYRPVSISVGSDKAFLVLHRPLIPDAKKEQLAIRQGAAAAALLRLGQSASVWPLLGHAPDLRVRSYLLSRLNGSQVDPSIVLNALYGEDNAAEDNPARRHAMIIAVGQYAGADLLTPDQQQTALEWLKGAYADDPDPGVHGAAEWALRQMGAQKTIDEIRQAYATGQPVGDRRWYFSKTVASSEKNDPPETQQVQPLSLAMIDGTEPFLMGTPVSEADRFGGPAGKGEIRHLRTIGYRYAIGMHEVTVAQFKQFLPRHDFNRIYARESDAPANMGTWYEAAAYCNWLSEREGIPRDQWCYDPEQPFAEGMILPADHLQRTGYRLATEAEWEHACRAGTVTSRYYGETDQLLGEYGWYTKNSGDRFMLPVGAQRPNPRGLFGLQGNALEWCVDAAILYEKEGMGGVGGLSKMGGNQSRVLRGGSFGDGASYLRSGVRYYYVRPDNRNLYFGFRLSRTYP